MTKPKLKQGEYEIFSHIDITNLIIVIRTSYVVLFLCTSYGMSSNLQHIQC